MQASALQHWLDKRLENIAESAAAVKPDLFPETIHHFRTETKKLRAILRLIHAEDSGAHKLPKSFRKLYRLAGEIRDRQMQLMFITSGRRNKLPHFSIWLATQIAHATRGWNQRYDPKVIEALAERCDKLPNSLPNLAELRRFFQERTTRMSDIIEEAPGDSELHELRKLVKDLQYLTTFCEKEWPKAYGLLQPKELRLQRLSERAGNYNDRSNLLTSLALFKEVYAEQPDQDKTAIDKALHEWGAAADRERTRLIASIRSFVKGMKI